MTTSKFLAICYGDIFDYPLKEEELERWGINKRVILGSISDSRIDSGQARMTKKGEFYCLKGREKIIKLRNERAKYSSQKLLIAKKIAKVLQKCSLVKMVAVTGALAMENSAKNDDIDLMIVTEKNRVWLTRLLTTLILDILGKRRKRNEENFSDKICLNMFLDEGRLLIPVKEQNLYTAHEICQVKPLYNQSQTYEKFLLANKWAKKYLPNGIDTRILGYYDIRRNNDKLRNIVISKYRNIVLDFLEHAAYKLQYFYMQKHITRETVTANRIMFHPKDTSKMVLGEFAKRAKE